MAHYLHRLKKEYKNAKRCKRDWLSDIFYNLQVYGHKKHFQDEFKDLLLYQVLDINLVSKEDDSGNSLLHCAAASGNVAIVGYLLIQPNIDTEAQNNAGKKPKDIICTKVLPSSDMGKEIIDMKIPHGVLSGPTSTYGVFYSCQDPNFKPFDAISSMFEEFASFTQSQVKKKNKKRSLDPVIQWPTSPIDVDLPVKTIPTVSQQQTLLTQSSVSGIYYQDDSSQPSPCTKIQKTAGSSSSKTAWPSSCKLGTPDYDSTSPIPTSPSYSPTSPDY